MKEVKKFLKSETKSLTLEICSDLNDLDLDAINPLWEVMEASALVGNFRVIVIKKIQGVHEFAAAVKVAGLNVLTSCVVVKVQCSPEYCYEGTLCGANGNSRMPASTINLALREVAGIGWFDPNRPGTKKAEYSAPLKPLVSVDHVITEATTPPAEDKPVEAPMPPSEPKKDLRGLSRDFNATSMIFRALYAMARSKSGGVITSAEIGDIVLASIPGIESQTDRKRIGPVINAWVDKGWLERIGKSGNVTSYRITQSAVTTFGLQVAPAQTESGSAQAKEPAVVPAEPIEAPSKPAAETAPAAVAVESEPLSDTDILDTFKALKEKAEKYGVAGRRSDELELLKMELEDKLREVQYKIDALKLVLDDAGLREAWTLWTNFSQLTKKSP